MKRVLFGCLPLFILFASCGSYDAELEKDLNTKIDKYGEATMKLCDCAESAQGDCEKERKEASSISEELSVVNELETEEKLDPEAYAAMLESIALINRDYSTCTQSLFKRLNEE